ncbi:MAG: DUF438 domain-containing protein [Bacillota bacterium]
MPIWSRPSFGRASTRRQITKLCDVHAAVFRDALEQNEKPELIPGHPMYSIKHENEEIKKVLAELDTLLAENNVSRFKERLSFFKENVDKHYSKKEKICSLTWSDTIFPVPRR